MIGERTDWMERAACIRSPWVDRNWFFPEECGKGRAMQVAAANARAVCADCPVVADCLALALEVRPESDHGIFGGTTPRERRKLRRAAR